MNKRQLEANKPGEFTQRDIDGGASRNTGGECAEPPVCADDFTYAEDYLKEVYCQDYRDHTCGDCCGANDIDFDA